MAMEMTTNETPTKGARETQGAGLPLQPKEGARGTSGREAAGLRARPPEAAGRGR